MQLLRFFHTIRHLRGQQLFYRLYYLLKRKWYRPGGPGPIPPQEQQPLRSCCWRQQYDAGNNSFSFLNRRRFFNGPPDWTFAGYGKLWNYHLNYWEWLEDEHIPAALRLRQMQEYAALRLPSDPYPASLRLIHWIRFCRKKDIYDADICRAIYRNARLVAAFPEYHLLANHLLENGLALWHAAVFFRDKQLELQACRILATELEKQVLPDGGHYERSVMYHTQLLLRLLQCLEIGGDDTQPVVALMRHKAACMLGWLEAYAFGDGSFACIGDATADETPPPALLQEYAAALGIAPVAPALRESGYRKFEGQGWELLFNAGGPAPYYQPGHSHADTFTYSLQHNGEPLVCDTGISTYERNGQRLLERSTAAHNTISLGDDNSSDVWASFRMGRRARVRITEESEGRLTVVHDGYRPLLHERTIVAGERWLEVRDRLTGGDRTRALWHLHFHPGIQINQKDACTFTAGKVLLRLEGLGNIRLEPYEYAAGYNQLMPALKLCAAPEKADVVILFEFLA